MEYYATIIITTIMNDNTELEKKKTIILAIMRALEIGVTFVDTDLGLVEAVNTSYYMQATAQGIYLSVSILSTPKNKNYKVTITPRTNVVNNIVTVENINYLIKCEPTTFDKQNPVTQAEVEKTGEFGTVAGAFFGVPQGTIPGSEPGRIPGLENNPKTEVAVTTGIIILLLGADPSGTLVKLSQYLKTYNKLYFINVNYGKRLDTFLSRIGDMFKTINEEDRTAFARVYRGKLSKRLITLDFLKGYKDKVIIYIVSWILRLFAARVIYWQVFESPTMVHVMYYTHKLFLVCYNMVRADFAFFVPRVFLHSNEVDYFELWLTGIVMVLLFLDCLEWVNMIFDDDLWMRLYRRKKRQIDDLARISNELEEAGKDTAAPTNQSLAMNTTDEKSRYSQGMVTQINYKRTWESLESNPHLLAMMSSALSVTEEVYASRSCRAHFTFLMLRLVWYNWCILVGQYACGLTIVAMMLFEATKLIYTLRLQSKLKFMSSKTMFVSETLQSSCLISFLTIALLVRGYGFNELVGDSYQDAGIWIIIASCGSEYILLLIFVTVILREQYLTRKARHIYNTRNKGKLPEYFTCAIVEKAPVSQPIVQEPQLKSVSDWLNQATRAVGASLECRPYFWAKKRRPNRQETSNDFLPKKVIEEQREGQEERERPQRVPRNEV